MVNRTKVSRERTQLHLPLLALKKQSRRECTASVTVVTGLNLTRPTNRHFNALNCLLETSHVTRPYLLLVSGNEFKIAADNEFIFCFCTFYCSSNVKKAVLLHKYSYDEV